MQVRQTVYWVACQVCGNDFPTCAEAHPQIERLNVCQRCCVADLAVVLRSSPEAVLMLPTVKALRERTLQ